LVIDVHVHVGWVRSVAWNIKGWLYADVDDLKGYMRECGVDRVFALSVPEGCDPLVNIVSNEILLRMVFGDDKIIPFCAVDPRSSNSVRRFLRLIGMGCKGLGEFKVPLKADDERSIELLKVADDYGLPVLFHMEDNRYFYGVESLENVLHMFPDTNFIAHGPGWWRRISKGSDTASYPKGKIEIEGDVQRLLREYRNLYADISATSGLNALKRDPSYAKRFLTEFSDRILFGTDFPCLSAEGGVFGLNRQHIDLLKSLELEDDVLHRILHGNAERLITQ